MQRRTFIKAASIFSITQLFSFRKLFGQSLLDDENTNLWGELLDYARWTASPHNVQPWRLKIISPIEAELLYDPNRLLIYTDPTSCFTIVGLSMFIESLNIAANTIGYAVIAEHEKEERLDYTTKENKLFAKLTLIEKNTINVLDRELIKQRKTSRLHYNREIIDKEIINELEKTAQQYGYFFVHSADEDMIDFCLQLNKETLFYDLDDDLSRQELSKWIRTTDKEAEEKKDGLWYKCMRFPGRLMHNFFFCHQRFRAKWKRKILGKVYIRSMKGTANVAWLNGHFSNREDWVHVGKMLQQLWITMTKYNVYMHPFGSVITNPIAYKKFIDKINYNKNDEKLFLLFRLGYSDEPPRSCRLEVKDILIS